MLQELDFSAGVFVDDSALAAKGRYVAANNIRFVRGRPQSRYGNEKFSTTALTGIARGIYAWRDNSGIPWLAVGTDQRLYALDTAGTVYDITPDVSYGTLTNPFSTDGTTATITVTHTAHGLVSNALVRFPYLTTTVNGATVTAATRYKITVSDVNTYTFTADTVSTSAGTPSVGVVDYRYGLNPGNVDGFEGSGWGTGGYGSGNYSGTASGLTLYPRTWTFAPWGQNLNANPRGGAIFEWAPNTSASEAVVNYAFTAATNWSVNPGWSVGSGTLSGSATGATTVQTITLATSAWHLVHVVASANSGSFNIEISGVTAVQSSANGHFNQPFYNGATASQALTIRGVGYTGDIRMVSVQTMTIAQQVLKSVSGEVGHTSPPQAACIFSTSERIEVACGVLDDNGALDPMRVRWTDQQNNQTWTAASSNLAGQYPLTAGAKIVRGIATNSENLIFTNTSVYAMRYTPDPNVVYDFVEIGPGTGLLGPNAVSVINGTVYWKAPSGQDYYYNGGIPTPITSNTIKRDFVDNLAWVQQDKVFSGLIGQWDEIIYHYPDSRDGSECSRYNKYNFGLDCWDPGIAAITCWLDRGIFPFPIAVDTSGYVRYMEKGNSVDGGALSWSIKSGKISDTDSRKFITINDVQLDPAGLMGGYSITVDATWKDIRGIHTKTFGPYGATAASGTTATRPKGQFLQITWSATSAPSFWRSGADLFDMRVDGDKR